MPLITSKLRFSLFVVAAILVVGCSAPVKQPAGIPLACSVIAHRGASAYLPEHTLPAYQLALAQGADFIELDVVLSGDGVPVVRHESWLSVSTDVATREEFANRQRSQLLRERDVLDWFSEDFSVAELTSLRAVERYPQLRPQSALNDGLYPVLTLQQVIDFWQQARAGSARRVGLYLELKQVAYFAQRGLDSVQLVLDVLHANDLRGPDDGVLLQSFDAAALQRVSNQSELPLVQLMKSREPPAIMLLAESDEFRHIASYADGIGVPKSYVYIPAPKDSAELPQQTGIVGQAHAAGLFVHVFTFRAENKYLPPEYRSTSAPTGDSAGHIMVFLDAGVDGVFTDNPDIGRSACELWQQAP